MLRTLAALCLLWAVVLSAACSTGPSSNSQPAAVSSATPARDASADPTATPESAQEESPEPPTATVSPTSGTGAGSGVQVNAPTPGPEQTATASPSPTPEPTSTPSPAPTATSTPTPKPEITMYVETDAYQSVNLRAKPTTASESLMALPYRARVRAAAESVRNGQGEEWRAVTYEGTKGYVYEPLLSKQRPKPMPPGLSGVVVDRATGDPVSGAWVYLDGLMTRTDDAGRYRFTRPVGNATLAVMAPGYARYAAPARDRTRHRVALEPFEAQGVYLPFYTATNPTQRERIFDLIDTTALNAVVVDIKSDEGWVWDTEVPLAHRLNAVYGGFDLGEFVREAHERDIYVIGRFNVFKDTKTATGQPDWAIRSSEGGLWRDDTENAYIDPFDERAWDYFADLAVEAAQLGVDEIQWDYVRFPVDGDLNTLRVDGEYTEDGRIGQIASYLEYMENRLRPAQVYISADIFGLTVWHTNENYLGQRLERMVPYLDYVSPMLYPSGFNAGSGGYDVPPANPYGLIKQSLEKTEARIGGMPVRVRPWLQAFNDYAWGLQYGVEEELAQRRASEEMGTSGWLFWNPSADYNAGSFVRNP